MLKNNVGFTDELTLKIARISHKQLETSGRENGTVPKRPRPVKAETSCDVVPLSNSGEQTLDVRSTVVRRSNSVRSGSGDCILTNIDCTCWVKLEGP